MTLATAWVKNVFQKAHVPRIEAPGRWPWGCNPLMISQLNGEHERWGGRRDEEKLEGCILSLVLSPSLLPSFHEKRCFPLPHLCTMIFLPHPRPELNGTRLIMGKTRSHLSSLNCYFQLFEILSQWWQASATSEQASTMPTQRTFLELRQLSPWKVTHVHICVQTHTWWSDYITSFKTKSLVTL